ncbi:MAG: HAD family hydrolase [Elusimicrobia bacterium HGW-Elusimicrobia-1]|jgi:phosphoglycolate phosphatase|nr:MAG: HAD family hydrolase [Elusimicrobia bacterium HGW-Elusimicrobia-1]
MISASIAIFDLDGTLLDTLEDLTDSINEALKRRGLPVHTSEAVKYFVGDGAEEFAARALPPELSGDVEYVRRAAAETMDEYSRRWRVKTRPYDGVPEMLAGIRSRGIKTAVLSNKPHDFTLLTAEHFFGRETFDIILGAGDDFRRKPDPAGIRIILEKLKAGPEAAFMLGDTATDMATAVAAGVKAIGALWGFRLAKELLAGGADILVEKPSDVAGLLL